VIRADTSPGPPAVSRLSCGPGDRRVTGPLAKRAEASRLCSGARRLVSLLTSKARTRRVCTQVYGGPQTLRLTGTIDARRVDRTFNRTDGCAIEEYGQVSRALAL